MGSGEVTGLVSKDPKIAFDTVDHTILCQKLEHYDVENRELSWFKSYLSTMRQLCWIYRVDSKIEAFETGVPQ